MMSIGATNFKILEYQIKRFGAEFDVAGKNLACLDVPGYQQMSVQSFSKLLPGGVAQQEFQIAPRARKTGEGNSKDNEVFEQNEAMSAVQHVLAFFKLMVDQFDAASQSRG
jgi:flagellar basal body rod protein FlgB